MTIDEYIEQRNAIQLKAEPGNQCNKIVDRQEAERFAQRVFTELGVANRHIERVLKHAIPLKAVEGEIQSCFRRVEKFLGESSNWQDF